MGVFGTIVFSEASIMRTAQTQLPESRTVGAQLVGNQQLRCEALLLKQLAHQPECRLRIAPTLNEHVEDLAFVVDGTPQIHPPARDPHHHLVEMPAIARPRATLAQPSRDRGTEFQHPTPYRFVGDVEPALGQQFLDIAVAQGEAEIEPDRVLDDLGRKTMAAIAERSHAVTLTLRAALARPVSVTKPLRLMALVSGLVAVAAVGYVALEATV